MMIVVMLLLAKNFQVILYNSPVTF